MTNNPANSPAPDRLSLSETEINLSPADRELDSALHALADGAHPRQAFVTALRGELETRYAAAPHRAPAPRSIWQKITWLRPLAAQGALVLLMVGLVVLAFNLTPHLTPRPGQGERLTPLAASGTPGTAVPVDYAPPADVPVDTDLPKGALARFGRGQILSLSASQDGRLAVGSTAGVCLYNPGLTEDWCAWLEQAVWRVLVSPSGDQIAVGLVESSEKVIIRILDAHTGSVLAERTFLADWVNHASTEPPMAWDPSGAPRLAVTEMETQVSVWDWQQDTIIWGPVTVHTSIRALDWSGVGSLSTIALGQNDGLAFLDGRIGEIKEQHDATWQAAPVLGIQALAFSAGGGHLVYAHSGGLIMMEYPQPGISSFPVEGATRLAWEQNQNAKFPRLAVLTGGQVQILQPTAEGVKPETLTAHANSPLAWDGQGNLFYVTEENMLGIYTGGQSSAVNDRYGGYPAYLTWSAQAELVSASENTIRHWSLGAVSLVRLPGADLLTLSEDGERALYYQPEEGVLIVWDATNNQQVSRIEVGRELSAWALSANHHWLAVAVKNTITAYDTDTGKRVLYEGQLFDQEAHINSLAWWPLSENGSEQPLDGTLAATWTTPLDEQRFQGNLSLVSLNGSLDWVQLDLIHNDGLISRPTWSPDGRLLASVVSQSVVVYDVEVKKIAHIFDDLPITPQANGGAMVSGELAFSPDSRQLAGGRMDALQVWDVDSAQVVHRYWAPSTVLSIAYGAGGLATGLLDGTILLWDLGIPLQPTTVEPTPTPLPIGEAPTPPAEGTPTPLVENTPVIQTPTLVLPLPASDIAPHRQSTSLYMKT